MTETEKNIIVKISDLARRMNFYTIWRKLSVSVLWGTVVAAVLISIGKFAVSPVPLSFVAVLSLVVSVVTGIIRGILARVSILKAAMIADAMFGLKERLTTAVEIIGDDNSSEMARLQLEDAAIHAQSLNPKSVYPHKFPITAKVLPLVLTVLAILVYVPYGQPSDVPPVVRQTIKQTGVEMEKLVREMDKNLLSDELVKLSSKVEITGRELQDKPLTKKDALKNLSNLTRRMEALNTMGEAAKALEGDMTPEKKRLLNELLQKLADNLEDIPEMKDFSQKVEKAQQENLSMEALRELSAALKRMKLGTSDMKALQQMSDQVAKGKRDIGRITSALARGQGSPDSQGEEKGLMGGANPGKNTVKDSSTEESYTSRIPSGKGFDSELDGQTSEKGRSIPTETKTDLKKGKSVMPYEEIYVKYREAADDAITRTAIPWMYKEQVKKYFDAIEPKGK